MEEQELSKKERKDLRRQERRDEVQKVKQQRGFKRLGIWAGVIALFGFGIWGVIANTPEPPETVEGSNLPVVTEKDHVKGAEDSSVVLVEYGDFQCPACGVYFPIVQQLEEEFGDRVQFVYRHYPLRSAHPQAESAARVSEAAGLQGKFWEMHDLLFAGQPQWSGDRNAQDTFVEYARELELDIEKFESDMDSSDVRDRVQQDLSGGNLAGVQGTPTFFLQGKRIASPQTHEVFQAILLEAL